MFLARSCPVSNSSRVWTRSRYETGEHEAARIWNEQQGAWDLFSNKRWYLLTFKTGFTWARPAGSFIFCHFFLFCPLDHFLFLSFVFWRHRGWGQAQGIFERSVFFILGGSRTMGVLSLMCWIFLHRPLSLFLFWLHCKFNKVPYWHTFSTSFMLCSFFSLLVWTKVWLDMLLFPALNTQKGSRSFVFFRQIRGLTILSVFLNCSNGHYQCLNAVIVHFAVVLEAIGTLCTEHQILPLLLTWLLYLDSGLIDSSRFGIRESLSVWGTSVVVSS